MRIKPSHMRILFVAFLFVTTNISAQTTLLSEDFSTASGSTPPIGWSVQTVQGDPAVDVWRFDNPGRRIPNAPIAGNFACFDSDKLSNNSLAEEVYLTSPVFNGTTTDNIFLEFNQYFVNGYGGSCAVEVYNGSTWISIYTNSTISINSQYSTFDITSYLRNITNARVRFKWVGNYSYFWIIDNIKIVTYPPTQLYIEQTGIVIAAFYDGDIAWGDIDNDGDLDLIITGRTSSVSYTPKPITKLYINENNSFIEKTEVVLPGVFQSRVKFFDFNNDGFLDIILAGAIGGQTSNYNPITKIFKNNGDKTFTELPNTNFIGLANGFIDIADYDNDGKLDILVSGSTGKEVLIKVYRNNGNESFIEQEGIKLESTGGFFYGYDDGLLDILESSGGWFDYNNDGFLDIVVGNKIYKNQGNSTFSKQLYYNIVNHGGTSTSFADYDNDGDLDILFTGTTTLYTNIRGNDTFSGYSFSLPKCYQGSSSWADFNNDGFLDILLNGANQSNNSYPFTSIYSNNNSNSFIAQSFNLPPMYLGSAKWGDYDNDGDLDLILSCGKLYINNGNSSNSAPTVPTIIESIINGNNVVLKWNPANDNESPSIGLTYNLKVGTSSNGQNIKSSQSLNNGTRCLPQIGNANNKTEYELKNLNKGTYYWKVQAIDGGLKGGEFSAEGQFTITSENQASEINFSNIEGSKVNISWKRGSKTQCIVFAKEGINEAVIPINGMNYTAFSSFGLGSQIDFSGWFCIYKGLGDNVNLTNLNPLSDYTIQVFEYDGILGEEVYFTETAYKNPSVVTTGWLTCMELKRLTAGFYGSLAFMDFNSDGNIDLSVHGTYRDGAFTYYSNYGFKNNENFNFNQAFSYGGLVNGSLACTDFNNDNYPDFIQTGNTANNLFQNNNNSTFSSVNFPNINIANGSIGWCDYDNDGDQDVILSGGSTTKLFKNTHAGFVQDTKTLLPNLSNTSLAWGDYDNDHAFDLLISGNDGTKSITKIYKNLGNGLFADQSNIVLKGVSSGSVVWGDYNNDGKLDILITGNDGTHDIAVVYKNTGTNFIEQSNIILTGVTNGSAVFGDFDRDNNLDIIIAGTITSSSLNIIKYYKNLGDGNFIEDTRMSIVGRPRCRLAIGDIDKDGDLDIAIIGDDSRYVNFYRNDIIKQVYAPSIPQNLSVSYHPDLVELKWDKVETENNQNNAFTYNVEIWNSDSIVCPSNSNLNGSRKIVGLGNAQNNNIYGIHNLPLGIYYWRVQAINNSYIGGNWSETDTIIVKKLLAGFIADTSCVGDSTHFIDNSLFGGLTISDYKWNFGDDSQSFYKDPNHLYENSGTYTVKYIVSSENFIDSIYQTVVVKPRPNANFQVKPSCEGDPIYFIDESLPHSTNLISWHWSLGDGKFSNLQNPLPNPYLKGDYTVKLEVLSDNGCGDTISKSLKIVEYPSAILSSQGLPVICQGDRYILSVPFNSNFSYQWKNNNINILNADSNVLEISQYSGKYLVDVVNTLAGCTRISDEVTVTVNPRPTIPAILVTGVTTFCKGDSVLLSVSPVSDVTYNWKLDGGNISGGTNSNTLYAQTSGNYTISLINSNSCSSLSANSVTVTAKEKPALPTVNLSGSTQFCDGGSVQLSVTNNPALSYQWKNGIAIITGANSNTYNATTSGSYSLLISNDQECSVETSVSNVTVNPMPAKPTIAEANSNTLFCLGTQVELKVTNASPILTYQWKRSGIAIDGANFANYQGPLTAGDYNVETKLGSCASESIILTLATKPAPAKPKIYARGPNVWILACDNLTASDYRWYYNEQLIIGAKTYLYSANQNLGNYYVEISDGGECYTMSDIINIPTGNIVNGINELIEDVITVYPNPTEGVFTVTLGNTLPGELNVELGDTFGKTIARYKFQNSNGFSIDLSGTPTGIYFCKMNYQNSIVVKKIVKQ